MRPTFGGTLHKPREAGYPLRSDKLVHSFQTSLSRYESRPTVTFDLTPYTLNLNLHHHLLFVESDRDDPGYPWLFHGDTVEDIRRLHGQLVMSDDDELGT